MPRKNKSRKKKGAGIFDFLKTGESKSYTKKRCKEYENEITKLEKRIDELKAKQEEYKCLGGDMMTDNPIQQPEPEPEPQPEPESQPKFDEPNQVDVEMDSSEEEEEEEDVEPSMKPLYKNDTTVEEVLDKVDAPENRKPDTIDKTITKDLIGGRRRRRKSRRKPKRKSRKRRKSRKKKKSRKRRRRKSRR